MIKNLRIELFLFLLVVAMLIAPINIDFFIYSHLYDFIQLETHSVVIHEKEQFHFVESKLVPGPVGFWPVLIDINTERVILKNIFEQITNLGSSVWYYFIIVFVFFVLPILKKFNIFTTNARKKILDSAKFSLFYLLLTSLLTQILKIIFGRARPNYTDFQNNLNLEFFTINPQYHSFPSGHSSTIFCVVIILGVLFPKLKYFFYISGLLVAVSRVLVGAHFVTDIFAGLIVAIITYKILKTLKNFFNKFDLGNIEKIKFPNNDVFYNSLVVFFVLGIFVSVSPLIDVAISNIFYLGDKQFYLQKTNYITVFFRKIYLPFLLVYVLFLTIFSRLYIVKKIFFNSVFHIKEIAFIWFASALTILFVVNFLLKDLWGRSRPNDLAFFEGDFLFTAWFTPMNFCKSNCSFVSGDASVGFLLIVLFFLTKNIWFFYISLFSGSVLGLIRISEGGHFFSDIIFAQIIVTVTLLISFILFKKNYDK